MINPTNNCSARSRQKMPWSHSSLPLQGMHPYNKIFLTKSKRNTQNPTNSSGLLQPREVDAPSINKQIPSFCWLLFFLPISELPFLHARKGCHEDAISSTTWEIRRVWSCIWYWPKLQITSNLGLSCLSLLKKSPKSNKTTLNPNPIPH